MGITYESECVEGKSCCIIRALAQFRSDGTRKESRARRRYDVDSEVKPVVKCRYCVVSPVKAKSH